MLAGFADRISVSPRLRRPVTMRERNWIEALARAPSDFSRLMRRWLDAIRDDGRPVLVMADNDDAGEAMRRKFIDELGDQVRQTVRVPDDHADFGDWWTAVGHADLEECARFVKMIETEGDRHGNP